MTKALAFLGRYWVHIAIAAVLLIALAKADANGAARASAQAERDKLRDQAIAQAIVNGISVKLDADLAELGRATNNQIAAINTEDRNLVQPIIRKGLLRDPALASRLCLTDELRRAINIARGAGGAAAEAADQRASPASVPGAAADRR